MRGTRSDVVHALRHYGGTPLGSAIAIAILAVAMAVLAAFVALWSELSFAPRAGFERSAKLVSVSHTDGRQLFAMPYQLVERIHSEAVTIKGMAGVQAMEMYVEDREDRIPLWGELVTEGYFPDLRPRMQLGRSFDAADHATDAEPVVIISHDFWQTRYGGRADALGEILRVHVPQSAIHPDDAMPERPAAAREYRVVGVLSVAMRGTFFPGMSLWMPYEPTVGQLAEPRQPLGLHGAVARLAPGADAAAVRNELRARYTEQDDFGLGPTFRSRLDVIPGVVHDFNQHRIVLRQVHLFLAGSALIALVAACNISLFLLSRATGRRRELAIRMAVGAPMRRLARQLITEAALLVGAAGLLAVLLSVWISVLVEELPFLRSVYWRNVDSLEWHVLAMIGACTLVLTALVSLAPVVGLERLGIATNSRRITARPGWTQRLAGTAQIGIAAVIGGAALAFLWHLMELERLDLGFSAPDVSVITVFPESAGRASERETSVPERERRRAVIAALPGIEDVAFGSSVPGELRDMGPLPVEAADNSEEEILAVVQGSDGSYFRLLGATLLDGRLPDNTGPDQVIVNETLALRVWGRTDVSGEIVPVPFPVAWEVVGVVRDIAYEHPFEAPRPMLFRLAPADTAHEWILVRTTRSAAYLRLAVQEKIEEGELELRLGEVRSIEELWSELVAPDRTRTGLAAASALVVILLVGFGSFGTQRFLVHAGRREYAILAAVGAGPRALGWAVLARGFGVGLPGILLGSVLSFITVAWLRGEHVSSSVSPAAVALVVVAVLTALLVLASVEPARYARRTDPGPLLKDD